MRFAGTSLRRGTRSRPRGLGSGSRCHDVTTAAVASPNGVDSDSTEYRIQVDPDEEFVCSLSGPPDSIDALVGGQWTSLDLRKTDTAFPDVATVLVPSPGLVLFATTPVCTRGVSTSADQLRIQFDDGVVIVAEPSDDLTAITVGCDGATGRRPPSRCRQR